MARNAKNITIKSIDRATVRVLREKAELALQELADALGVSVSIGRATFNNKNVSFKLEIAVLDANGDAETAEVSAFKEYSELFDVPASALGAPVVFQGKMLKLVGLIPSRPKYPFIAEDTFSNKRYKLTPEAVKSSLARQKAAPTPTKKTAPAPVAKKPAAKAPAKTTRAAKTTAKTPATKKTTKANPTTQRKTGGVSSKVTNTSAWSW